MLRILPIAAVLAAAACLSLGARPAAARGAPWCSEVTVGWGAVVTDCSFSTFEQCVPYVLAGNRGFCQENPYYSEPAPHKPAYRSRHRRR